MKIKMIRSAAGLSFSYSAGQEVDVPEDLAQSLVKHGHAVAVKQPKEKATAKRVVETRED